jgi:serine/threonine-protein kinase
MAQSFGPYVVLEAVARGSTGTVYRARHVELDRVAAIKELNADMLGMPGMRERLRAEAETLARLSDPHVVEVFDYVEEAGRAWIAEEWVTGAPLGRILDVHGALTPEQSVGVIRGAVLGLAHAHDVELLHRDVAPGNILADMAGTSKLLDFGLAAPVGEQGVFGTPAFMSPEAASGVPLGKPSDVYSVAAVLFTLLSGRPPYAGSDVAAVLRRHCEDPVPVLEGHGMDLQDLLRRSMAKDPSERPRDARAFLGELEEAARRRFGAAWLQRASVAGVVAGVMGVPTAVGGAVAGGAGASAAPTVVVDAASIAVGGRSQRASEDAGEDGAKSGGSGGSARWWTRKLPLAAAAALVVGAGAAATAVALTGGSEGPDSPEKRVAARTTEPSPSPTPTLADRVPTGDYRFTLTLVSFTSDSSPFKKDSGKWSLDLQDCGENSCKGTIKESNGSTLHYTWDGSTLGISLPNGGRTVDRGPCFDDETNEPVPGSRGRAVTVVTVGPMRVVETDTSGVPVRLRGQVLYRAAYEALTPGCEAGPPNRTIYDMVLFRR